MKTYVALVIVMTALAVAPALRAQQCYTPVMSWMGSYTLNANTSAVACTSGYTCSISQSSAAMVNMNQGPFAGCNSLGWLGFNGEVTAMSANDKATGSCGDTTVDQGSSGQSLQDFLSILLTSGTYQYDPHPAANVTKTVTDCKGNVTTTQSQIVLWPDSNWPQTFTLPAIVGTAYCGRLL
jgi:hypothetical protein